MRPSARARLARPAASGGGVSLEQRVLGFGVERGRRLVEHEHRRVIAPRPAGERELLRHCPNDTSTPPEPGGPELCHEAAFSFTTTSSAPARATPPTAAGSSSRRGCPRRRPCDVPGTRSERNPGCASRRSRHSGGVHAAGSDPSTRMCPDVGSYGLARSFTSVTLAPRVLSRQHNGAGRQFEVHILEDKPFSARVRERHVIETDALLEPGWYGQVGASNK